MNEDSGIGNVKASNSTIKEYLDTIPGKCIENTMDISLLDTVTNCLVATQLYENDHAELFAVSCLVISFTFIIICVWLVSLRFVQKFATNIDIFTNCSQSRRGDSSGTSWIMSSGSNNNLFGGNSSDGGMSSNINTIEPMYFKVISRLYYLFPPLGCFVASLYEAGWVFYHAYLGLKSFFNGTILIIDKDEETTTAKQFGKFAQSISQTILQLFIYSNIETIGVNENDLVVSLSISVFNLFYNCWKINIGRESQYHEMSLLQLSMRHACHIFSFCPFVFFF